MAKGKTVNYLYAFVVGSKRKCLRYAEEKE